MSNFKNCLCMASALPALAMATPLYAQAAVPAVDSATAGVQDIVVTAQRRQESMQRVPVAVSAIGTTEMKNLHIDSVNKVELVVPSLKITSEASSVTLFLRGVGSSITAIGNEASVPLYIDGVYFSRISPALLRLNNVERVEVLKGPQGTLFGRNASGGLVQIITKTPKPGQDFEMNAEVGYGNYDTIDGSASVTGSLGSRAALSVSGVYHNQRNGWGKNITTGAENLTDKSDALRAKLVVDVTDSLKATATAEYAYTDSDIGAPQHYRNSLQASFAPPPASGALPIIGIYDSQANDKSIQTSKYFGGSLRLEQDFGFATLINTTAYHRTKLGYQIDLDAGPASLLTVTLPASIRELINELQLVSNPSSSFDWSVGGFYMDQKQQYSPAHLFGPLIDGQIGGAGELQYQSVSTVKAASIFAQTRFKILERLKLTLGARYSHDELHGYGNTSIQYIGAAPFAIPGTVVDDKRNVDKVTYKAVLDYQFTNSILGYASVSRGYKGSTYAMLPIAAPPAKPEVLDAYELGLKSDLFDRLLRFNAAAFWYEITNQQVITTPTAGSALTSNAPKARIKGAEFEIQLVPTSALRFHAAMTYLDAKYIIYPNAGITLPNPNDGTVPYLFGNLPTAPFNAAGQQMVRAPKLSGNIGAQYRIEMANGGAVDLTGNISYTSRVYFEPDHRVTQGGYSLVSGQIAYTFPNQHLQMRLWGENLTDKKYYSAANATGSFGGDIGAPGAPRTYGVTLGFTY